MKIFSVSQIRAADQYTIQQEPISSIDLMERAARACYNWFHAHISREKKIAIYCGKGNNGGDGLALSRMLAMAGYAHVSVYVIAHSKNASEDFRVNEERLKKLAVSMTHLDSSTGVEQADVIVDAILGSGLNSPLRGLLADMVDVLNATEALKIAIDIPTGLFADGNTGNNLNHIFKADRTFSFQFLKWSFLFPEFGPLAGKIEVLDIGLSRAFINKTETDNYAIDKEMVRQILPERHKFDYKGTFGHALIIAGSKGKIGASILATKAALKTGAGLVTAYVPGCGLVPLQTANPEVMTLIDEGADAVEQIQFTIAPTAIGIGPGMGTATKTKATFEQFLKEQEKPLVIDADGLNLLAETKTWSTVPKNSILTPHLGELDRLLGKRYRGEEMFVAARDFAIEKELIVVVKGAHTAIYAPSGQVYFNTTGTNGMATAGSGDVLTGMITGFLAQGIDAIHAAICGVFFHGLAGEKAAQRCGDAAMTAKDVIENLKIEL